jgi:flagellar protein FliO/FliZ
MERLRVIPFAIAAAVLAAPLPAFASPKGEDTPVHLGGDNAIESTAAGGGGGGSIVRTLVGLAVVVGLIYGLHWILKQAKASKEGKASGLGLSTVATLPIGGGRSVQLLRAGRELVLVGVAEHAVTPIRRYSEDEARSLGLLPDETSDNGRPPKDEAESGVRRFVSALREKTVIK